MQSSKDIIREHLRDVTVACELESADGLQASTVAAELHISRSTASSYMNALHSEGILIKVAARPTLFFDRSALEQRFGIAINQGTFLSVAELRRYIDGRQEVRYDFQDIIGATGSLKEVIDQAKAAACYPPHGLPYLLSGADRCGKAEFRGAVIRWCVSEGIVRSASAVYVADAAAFSADLEADALNLSPAATDLVWITECQNLSDAAWSFLFAQYEAAERTHDGRSAAMSPRTRLFLDCKGSAASSISPLYLRRIPVVSIYPEFSARALDEREACVYHAFQEESVRIDRRVLVSASVVKRLVGLDSITSLSSLRRMVQMACANAMAAAAPGAGTAAVHVLGAHVPAGRGAPFDAGLINESLSFVDVATYDPLQRGAEVLRPLSRFFEALAACPASREPSAEDESIIYQRLSRYLELVGECRRGHARDSLDQAVAQIAERVFDRYGINEPVGLVAHLVNAAAFFRENRLAVEAFRERMGAALCDGARRALAHHWSYEASIISGLSNALQDCLGWGIDTENRLALAFYLHWCIREQKIRCAGVIVAHGYSTASSLAAAVNTMLRQHVFDALDMPLDVSGEEIERQLERYVSKMPLRKDLLIMVDMGSLESVGDRLNLSLRVNVGVIDNVSTATALEAGSLILQQYSVEDILPRVRECAVCAYSLHRNERKRQAVLFVSENGLAAAARLAELFFSSLPRSLDLEAVPCEYLTVADEVENGIYRGKQVLFVLGTSNPGIAGVNFVLLESIVDMTGEDSIGVDLSAYLAPTEIDTLRANLVKNFTLENLMRHLTILEPDRLMEVVSGSIEQLQRRLGTRFSYRMLMRLYVHISYLVERLVTRRYVEDAETGDFEGAEPEFIESVRASFHDIIAAYGVELPISEIHYVFALIHSEEARGGDAVDDDFFGN